MQLPRDMNVIEISGAGGPDVLKPARRPLPKPASDEVLIKVAAAGVNGPDRLQRRGLYPPPPGASDLPGLEISGEVAQLGEGVTRWAIGDRITALTNGGGYADYCAVNADHCLPIPHGVELIDAAGLPETFFTVWSNLFMEAGLKAGQRLLVHGGAGGIGMTAIQLGKAFGAHVTTTASPTERCEACRLLGADRVIDYRTEDFVEIVRAEGGADVILDIVGGPYIERNIKAASPDARIIQLAFLQGSRIEVDLMPIMLKRLTYTGSTLRPRPPAYKARIAEELARKVWPLFAKGQVKTVTSRTFPLAEAAAAHSFMESGTHIGKILLVPDHNT
jgi:putative PIG3 family NAD(P)H quinone oxidoreductase